MIVEKLVSRTIDPKLFDMLSKAITHEAQQHDRSGRKEIAPLMYELYNVRISELTKLDDGMNVHLVSFDSEQDYVWFMLRWA
jgi:hypothetical protein